MKPSLETCKALAVDIIVMLYESDCGGELEDMLALANSKIADAIEAHDRDIISMSHYEHVEAAKRCGE